MGREREGGTRRDLRPLRVVRVRDAWVGRSSGSSPGAYLERWVVLVWERKASFGYGIEWCVRAVHMGVEVPRRFDVTRQRWLRATIRRLPEGYGIPEAPEVLPSLHRARERARMLAGVVCSRGGERRINPVGLERYTL